MARSSSKHPTEAELEILKIIWSQGHCTVRQVQQAMHHEKPRAYTSIMTLMTIMTRKGYLRRRKLSDGGYVYAPRVDQGQTSRGMLHDLIDRLFSGSTMAAVLHLLDDRELDDDELRQLRKLVNRKTTRDEP